MLEKPFIISVTRATFFLYICGVCFLLDNFSKDLFNRISEAVVQKNELHIQTWGRGDGNILAVTADHVAVSLWR